MSRRWLKKLGNSMLSFTLIVSLVTVAMPIQVNAETEAVEIGIDVKKAYDVDVVLALDNSTQNIDSYKEDLQHALEIRGVNASNLNIQSVQVNETNILEGTFKLNLRWPGPAGIDMDAHVEFWEENATQMATELYYGRKKVYESTLDFDDRSGGTGEIIALSLNTIPEEISELKVYINPFNGFADTTMYLFKTVNGVEQEIINHSGYVDSKFYFGSFKRNQDSWDFYFNNGSIFKGKEVEIISKDFMEVLREPDWRPSARKYLVNLNDETVSDFDDSVALGEIITRMNNDQIHYIGWGSDSDNEGSDDLTQNQAESFINKNNRMGTFINRTGSSYEQQIEQTADYIASQSRNEDNNEFLELGQNYDLIVSPSSELSNTKDENWPNGKWKIEHDPSIYKNNTGVVPYSGQYLDDFNPTFNKVGKYDIYYADALVKTLYVHRQPVSRFDVEVNDSNEVVLTNRSYDLDTPDENDGIEEVIWKWKRTTDESWTSGQPSSFVPNEDYIIQLMVRDYQGTWSIARSRYQSTQPGAGKPISDFELSANELTWPSSTIQIEDTSYDPRSASITEKEWKVYKGNEEIYSGNTPKLDFSDQSVGTYKISLRTKNQHGTWSETFSRFLKILPNSKPTMTSIGDQAITEGTTREFGFQVDDAETGVYSVAVTGTSSDQTKIPNENIVVRGNGKDRVVSVKPVLGQAGEVTITLSATDGDKSIEESFKVTVVEKSAPAISSIEDQSINIGTPSEEISFTISDEVVDANLITVTATSSNQELIADSSIELGGTDEDRTIRFTPTAGASGTADITIEATDPSGKKSIQIFKVTVSDLTPPNVVNVEVLSPDVRYKAGDPIVIKVTFDEEVIVNGVPELALDFGSEPTRQAKYTGGSPSNELIFEYTIQAGDDTEEIRIAAEQALQLADGTIQDGNENNANLNLSEDFVWDTLIVDTTPPDRPSIEAQAVQPGTSINITSSAPSEGETAWLAPSGTTSFEEGTTMTQLVGDGTKDIIPAPLAEGTYYLYVIDANGNVSTASENAVIVDNTPPNIALMTLPIANDNAINKQEAEAVIISGTAEANAKVEVTFIDQNLDLIVITTNVDENGNWSIDPSDISSLVDGTITVSVKVIDAAGNESVKITQWIFKDTVSPITQDDVLANNRYVKGGTTITLDSAAGDGEKIFVAPYGTLLQDLLANGETITSVTGNYSSITAPSVDGTYYIYIVDAAGNLSETSQASIVVDNILPTIDSLDPSTTDWVNDSVLVSINASDKDGSGIAEVKYAYGIQPVNYFIANGIAADDDLFGVDVNGIYTVYVRDLAGNERVEFIHVTNIDKVKPTAPIINLQPDRDFYNNEYTITITPGQDALSGVNYTEYRIVGAVEQDWTQYEEPLVFTDEGMYTIETITYDNAGNVSDTTTRTVVINREIAVFPSVSISPDVALSNENITVKISKSFDESDQVEAEHAVIYYKLPGMDQFVEYNEPFVIEQEGQTLIEIMIVDRSGNEVTITKTVNIDKTPPINQDQIIEENVLTKGNTLIPIQPSDDSEDTIWLAPEGTVSFEESGTMTKTSGDTTKIVTPQLDGEYKIYVVDKAGNISLASDKTVTVDNIPPNVTGIEDGETYKEYPTVSFDEGVATLNGEPFETGTKIEANGEYTFVLTDAAGNSTVVKITVDFDKESVDKDTEALQLEFAAGDYPKWVSTDILLSEEGFYGSDIKWSSSHEDILSAEGKVTPPTVDTEVTLTATITKGDYTLEKTFTVLVIADPVKPVIALHGSSNVVVEQGQIYVELGAQAIDNIDGNITDKVAMSGFIDTKTIGEYTLVYTVSDQAGNIAQIERTVTVVKATTPASTIIPVDGDQKSTDNKIKEALKEAKKQKSGKIVLVVNEEVEYDAPIQVSIGKDQLKTAFNQNTKIELHTGNASIIVPIRELDLTQFTGNSRLELVIEKVDVEQEENQVLVNAIENMNANFAIYDGKVFDFKMRVIEEDSQGNVTSTKDIENFQTTEDIVLNIFVGANIDEQLRFMTFYFNETSEEWEYIRSSYDEESGDMTLLTNHLSIYSVMKSTKAQKQAELTTILNKENITIKEVRSIIEDPDMDFDHDAMTKYDAFTDVHKDTVAKDIVTKKPTAGYDYPSLRDQVTNSVNSKHEAITADPEKPVIKLSGPSVVYVQKGKAYIEQGVTATDNQDGDITGRVIMIGSVDTTKNGTYILLYIITDANGNQSEITRKVIVQNASSDDEVVVVPEEEPTLPVVIVDSKNTGYVIKENKDNTIVLTKEPQMHVVGQVYNVEAVSAETAGHIVIQFSYDPSEITNLNQLAIYKYNEAEKRWVVVGGIVDAQNHTVTITLDSPATLALMENKVVFNDLDGHWAKNIVELLAARQIITGDNEGNFNPNIGITRAEFSTLIVRMLNLPMNESESQFADVTDKWYESYITTAQAFGIVKGVSETSFEPERVVSRQEMAAIIIRTLKKYEDVTVTEEDLKQIAEFSDSEDISGWAFEDVYTARKLELMIGRNGNKFAPQSPTLRGEAASVIYNLLKELELI